MEEVVRIKGLHGGTEEGVPKVETGADQRALGVQVDMEGCWSGAVRKAGDEVKVTARAIRQMPSVKPLVEVCGNAVLGVAEAAVQDEAAECVSGEEVRKICQPLRRAFL